MHADQELNAEVGPAHPEHGTIARYVRGCIRDELCPADGYSCREVNRLVARDPRFAELYRSGLRGEALEEAYDEARDQAVDVVDQVMAPGGIVKAQPGAAGGLRLVPARPEGSEHHPAGRARPSTVGRAGPGILPMFLVFDAAGVPVFASTDEGHAAAQLDQLRQAEGGPSDG